MRAACLSAILLAATVVLGAHCYGADAVRTVVFLKAQFLRSDDPRPPQDDAQWKTVTLPHVWHTTDPGFAGLGWYRIQFNLSQVPESVQAIEIDHWRSVWVEFYLNGAAIGGSRETIGGGGLGFGTPVFLTIPPTLLHPGMNVLLAHMRTLPKYLNVQGLGRVTFGDSRHVREVSVITKNLGFSIWRVFYAMAFAAGVIAFFAWLARRSDRVLLWYWVACLSWVVGCALWTETRWAGSLEVLNRIVLYYRQYGLAVPAVVLSLRIAHVRKPLFETLLWAFLAAEIAFGVSNLPFKIIGSIALDMLNAALLVGGAAIVLRAARRPYRWPEMTAVASLVAMGVLMLDQPAHFLGWVDVENPMLRPFHVPVLVFAIGAAIFDRHVRAIWRMERSNVALQRRVDEKARELEAYHAEREERVRQQALVRERQRILADVHDGLGASLVGLLRYVQGGAADPRGLESRVKEAIQELRIAIDALEPSEGDLGGVLGKLRYRLEPLTQSIGAHLTWEVDELPQVESLEPSAVFAIQRILLEAVSNAVQHAGAKQIRVTARARGTDAIVVSVEDDGKGMSASPSATGRGLSNMRRRAEALGASLEVTARPGGGTVVSLELPRRIAPQAPMAYPVAATG
jgi:signal transduction histidine kinase